MAEKYGDSPASQEEEIDKSSISYWLKKGLEVTVNFILSFLLGILFLVMAVPMLLYVFVCMVIGKEMVFKLPFVKYPEKAKA